MKPGGATCAPSPVPDTSDSAYGSNLPLPAKIQLPELPSGRGRSECLQLTSWTLETPNAAPGPTSQDSIPAAGTFFPNTQQPSSPITLCASGMKGDEASQCPTMPQPHHPDPHNRGDPSGMKGDIPPALPQPGQCPTPAAKEGCQERCSSTWRGARAAWRGAIQTLPAALPSEEGRGAAALALAAAGSQPGRILQALPAPSLRPALPATAPSST